MSAPSMKRRLDRLRDDDGVTMAELIITSIVTVIVLIAVGGMYISTLRTERIITDLSETTTSAQLVARSIDAGVRNGVELTAVVTGGDGGQMVAVCTADATELGPNYVWRAWYYSPVGVGELRTRDFASASTPSAPTATELADWSLLLTGVDARLAGGVFEVSGTPASVLTLAFSANSGRTDTKSATIEFAPHLAPPTFAPGSEPCS